VGAFVGLQHLNLVYAKPVRAGATSQPPGAQPVEQISDVPAHGSMLAQVLRPVPLIGYCRPAAAVQPIWVRHLPRMTLQVPAG